MMHNFMLWLKSLISKQPVIHFKDCDFGEYKDRRIEELEREPYIAKQQAKRIEELEKERDAWETTYRCKRKECEALESMLARYENWATAAITHFENIGDNSSVMMLSLRALREGR